VIRLLILNHQKEREEGSEREVRKRVQCLGTSLHHPTELKRRKRREFFSLRRGEAQLSACVVPREKGRLQGLFKEKRRDRPAEDQTERRRRKVGEKTCSVSLKNSGGKGQYLSA